MQASFQQKRKSHDGGRGGVYSLYLCRQYIYIYAQAPLPVDASYAHTVRVLQEGCLHTLRNVSLELRNVSLELRNVSLELRNVSFWLTHGGGLSQVGATNGNAASEKSQF